MNFVLMKYIYLIFKPLLIRSIEYYLEKNEPKIKSLAEYYLEELLINESNNSIRGFKLESIIAWRFCEFYNFKFCELPIFLLDKDENISNRDKINNILKNISKENFDIYKVKELKDLKENHKFFENSQNDNEDDNEFNKKNDEKTLYYYLKYWDNYLNIAILPEFLAGPDICIFFSNYLILFSIALRKDKVKKDKLRKNYEKTNFLNFYHEDNGNIQNGKDELYKECKEIIKNRFKEGKLKIIIRIHIALPNSSKDQSGLFPQNCISYEEIKIKKTQYQIPSIVIDISGENIDKANIFNKNIIKRINNSYKNEIGEENDEDIEESNENEIIENKKRKEMDKIDEVNSENEKKKKKKN